MAEMAATRLCSRVLQVALGARHSRNLHHSNGPVPGGCDGAPRF